MAGNRGLNINEGDETASKKTMLTIRRVDRDNGMASAIENRAWTEIVSIVYEIRRGGRIVKADERA